MNTQVIWVVACVLSFVLGGMLPIHLMSRALKMSVREILILLLAASKGEEIGDDEGDD